MPSDQAAPGSGWSAPVSRRTVLGGLSLLPLTAAVPGVGTDLPYLSNNVTLDPNVTDLNGRPVPHITYTPGKHEQVAQTFYLLPITAMIAASGANLFAAIPDNIERQVGGGSPPDTKHVMGGMQMGVSPQTSVTDPNGRMHQMDNVYVADGSVFVTSGCQNPPTRSWRWRCAPRAV